MNILKRIVPLLFVFLLLSACLHKGVEDFYFIEYSGLKRPLLDEPAVPAGEESLLLPAETGMATPFFWLEEKVQVRDADRAFFIVYTTDCPLILKTKIDGEYLRTTLPFYPGREIEYRLPLMQNTSLEGFQLETEASGGSLRILGTGVEDLFPGARISEELIVIGHGVGVSSLPGTTELHFDPPSIGFRPGGHFQLDLRIGESEPVELLASGPAGSAQMTLMPREGRNRIDLYPSVLGFVPEKLRLHGSNLDIELFGVHPDTVSDKPLSIDFSSLLLYPESAWRQGEYELFRWNLAPEVLIFDFRDYRVQADFLKRLAFFVEKDGFRGSLLTDEELEGRHGWNAHDYRAADLARFFTLASKQEFPLNSAERVLEGLLLENGIIIEAEEGYEPGKGAIISISRESGEYLRGLFLTHEGFHALYFIDSGFRERSAELWNGFSEAEKSFWHAFLAWKHYDPEDPFLVENELQAYLLQQTIERADPYYIDYTLPRMAVSQPNAAAAIDALLADNPDHFTRSAAFLEVYLAKVWGIRAGDLENLKFTQ